MKTQYTITLVITIALFCVPSIYASSPKVIWHVGRVTLVDKTVLEGSISYNWLAEMVMIHQPDGRLRALSANQVLEFGWFDYNLYKQRDFKSLSGSMDTDRINRRFFEVCMDGSLSVVRRLRRPHGLFKRAFGHPSHYTDQPTMAQDTDHFDYFVHDAGQLIALDQFYGAIYEPLMTAYDQELQHYAQKHNLNTRSLLGRLVLIDHYNFLAQKNTQSASARSYGTIQD